MGIRSKFQGKHTKNCILKTVLKKNATVVVKMCPKNYLFCIPKNFLPQPFSTLLIFLHRYICHICDIMQLCPSLGCPTNTEPKQMGKWKRKKYFTFTFQNNSLLYWLQKKQTNFLPDDNTTFSAHFALESLSLSGFCW